LSDAVLIAAGSDNSCALRANGEVVCWGTDYLPTDEYAPNTPRLIDGVQSPVSIAVGYGHLCAALSTGEVACWGLNTSYQAGALHPSTIFDPTVVTGLGAAELVAAGESHSCAVQSGKVSCWGENSHAELGIDRRSEPMAEPQAVVGLSSVVQIAAGDFHTCVLLSSGDIRCWGNNEWGQLGDGTDDTGLIPVRPLPVQ
jgi:alpha-tubulin suppressor-like RCC1 family protein